MSKFGPAICSDMSLMQDVKKEGKENLKFFCCLEFVPGHVVCVCVCGGQSLAAQPVVLARAIICEPR